MPDTNVVTSQPVSAANNLLASAPPESVIVTQPLNDEKHIHIPLNEVAENGAGMHTNTYTFVPPSAPNMTEQPVNSDEKITPELTRADAMKSEEEERMRQRRNDYCCFACADSYVDDDIFCWYMFWRCYCQCLGHFCEGVSNCTDSLCDGCASCLGSCCECGDQDGCCVGCCDDTVGDPVTGSDGGCCSDGGGGDCDCDCDCL